ncbi:MAG: CDP-diacylglycerol--serine O-phosphatidyltransferase [Clostridiales bacterium]|nr:CDP-diacylglycerol--serine O-phosphatidyltransferase [Clostridiales bacterium]
MIEMLKLECDELSKLHILPNAITYVNMSLGAIAIFISANSNPNNIKIASILILIAGIVDKLDGYIARKMKATSKFGKELDSLCDLVSFGIAPILLWWNINKGLLGISETLVSLFFIGGAAYRLARYNATKEDKYIVGLPITIAGMIVAGKQLIDISYRLELVDQSIINIENMLIITLLSALMINSFKIKKPCIKFF